MYFHVISISQAWWTGNYSQNYYRIGGWSGEGGGHHGRVEGANWGEETLDWLCSDNQMDVKVWLSRNRFHTLASLMVKVTSIKLISSFNREGEDKLKITHTVVIWLWPGNTSHLQLKPFTFVPASLYLSLSSLNGLTCYGIAEASRG